MEIPAGSGNRLTRFNDDARPTSPSRGGRKSEAFSGGGRNLARSSPPPETLSLRYSVSTSPQGGGRKEKRGRAFALPLPPGIPVCPRERLRGLVVDDLRVVADCGRADRDVAVHIGDVGVLGRIDARFVHLVVLHGAVF